MSSTRQMKSRYIAAVTAGAVLAALAAADGIFSGARFWFDRHDLLASLVANLVTLAFAALVVDQIVARRQRRERASSVAVQALIVFAQARRAVDALTSPSGKGDGASVDDAQELRELANMLLAASPSLLDDPAGRRFLNEVHHLSASMFRVARTTAAAEHTGTAARGRDELTHQLAKVEEAVTPLVDHIRRVDRSLLEGYS